MSRRSQSGFREDNHVQDCLVWSAPDFPPATTTAANTSGRVYARKGEVGKAVDRGYTMTSRPPSAQSQKVARPAVRDALMGWPMDRPPSSYRAQSSSRPQTGHRDLPTYRSQTPSFQPQAFSRPQSSSRQQTGPCDLPSHRTPTPSLPRQPNDPRDIHSHRTPTPSIPHQPNDPRDLPTHRTPTPSIPRQSPGPRDLPSRGGEDGRRVLQDTVMDAVNGWPDILPPGHTPTPTPHVTFSEEVKDDYTHAYPWIQPSLASY